MVHFRTFLAVLSAAAAVTAVPVVKRTDHGEGAPSPEHAAESAPAYDAYAEAAVEAPAYDAYAEAAVEAPAEWEASASYEAPAYEASPAPEWEEPEAAVAAEEVAAPAYGSGAWDKTAYNDCVSQCNAKYGSGESGLYEPPAAPAGSGGAAGTGASHTVIVAPTQGVLRFLPPFVSADVGDTIVFNWGANNHTVSKGSALLPCNKTADAFFGSGVQNKDFTFSQVVNDTTPTYIYCATPGHCTKGMFGVINPAKANGTDTAAGAWIKAQYGSNSSNVTAPAANVTAPAANVTAPAANVTDMSSYWSYTKELTKENPAAAEWGSDYDMSALPDWAKEGMAGNIMYYRNVIASNPDMVDAEGKVAVAASALSLPQDVPASNNAAAADTTTTPAAAPPATPPAGAPAAGAEDASQVAGAASDQPASNGAGALASSKVAMGAAVIFATVFLL